MSLGFTGNIFINEKNDIPWSGSTENSNDSTESSSTQSWLDETENSTTKELQEQYDKFEAALYREESAGDLPKYLQDEVRIWSEHSPHIRIRGIKANLNERPEDFEEEQYASCYEEILAQHGTLEENLEKTLSFNEDVKEVIENCSPDRQEVIRDDLKNAIVDKLFDQAWPKVLEKFEPMIKSMSGRRKKTAESFSTTESYLENMRNEMNTNSAARSNSSRSYMREMMTRKPFVDSSTEYQGILSSRGLRAHTQPQPTSGTKVTNQRSAPKVLSKRISNVMVPKATNKISSSGQNSDKKKPVSKKSDQPIILPPIEVLSITPQKSVERPKQKLDQSKKRISTAHHQNRKELPGDPDQDIQIIGTRSATVTKSNRWHH